MESNYMRSNIRFFEKRIGNSFHYQNYWMDRYAREQRERIIKKHIHIHGASLVDYGCGDGSWGEFYRYLGAHKVHGIEQSKRLASSAMIPTTTDMTSIADNSCDVILAITSLNFTLPKLRSKTIREFYRILKPHGLAATIDYMPNFVPDYQKVLTYKEVWNKKQWIDAFRLEGFCIHDMAPVNWIDTTIFHYLGASRMTYYLTKVVDSLLCSLGIQPKYWLLIFEK